MKTKNVPNALNHLIESSLKIEKMRIASQIRLSHLSLNSQTDPETVELEKRIEDLEKWVDGRVKVLVKTHPAYPWFHRVKGIGGENIGKVLYPINIQEADTISALWRFCGFAVIDGHSDKRTQGEKLHYSNELRSMCWRLSKSLIRANGKFYAYYIHEKDSLMERCARQGIKVLATPSGKWLCTSCEKSATKKVELEGCCENPHLVKKLREEPEGVMWLGHLDMMALRKMIKLFLGCLWLVWRETEHLPTRAPYAIERLEHTTLIDPWSMVDR